MKTSTSPRRALSALPFILSFTLPLFAACSDITTDQVEDLGNTTSSNLDVEPSPTEPFFAPASDFYGTWIGEASDTLAFGATPGAAPAYHFPSGSSTIVLTLGPNPDGHPAPFGTITFGTGAPPPPPTSSDTTYPPGFSYVDALNYKKDGFNPRAIGDAAPIPPFEGFAYQLTPFFNLGEDDTTDNLGGLADGVLRLFFDANEILAPWCELQTPVLGKDGNYRCAPLLDQYAWDEATNTCFAEEHDDESACPPDVWSLPDEEFRAVYDACAIQGQSIALDCNTVFLCGSSSDEPGGRCECDSTHCYQGYQSRTWDGSVNMHLRRVGVALNVVIEGGLFFNERGLRVPLGPVTLRRAE